MQVNVPHWKYGTCDYFMPKEMAAWLRNLGLDYTLVGGSSWGDGTTNGRSNVESVYMVHNIQEPDSSAFQIQFPECHLYVCKQHEYT